MMRILAYISNFAFLVAIFWSLLFEQKRVDGQMLLVFLFLFSVPVVNLVALHASAKSKDFLALFFERKKLEQMKRIMEIKRSLGEDS